MTLEQKMGNIIRMESLFSDIPIKIKAYTFSPYLNDESNSSPFSISSMLLSYRNISSKKINLSFRAKVLKYYRPDFHDKLISRSKMFITEWITRLRKVNKNQRKSFVNLIVSLVNEWNLSKIFK